MGVLELFRIDNQIALVTGAARGIGQTIAIALAEAGANIACCDILPCDETCDAIRSRGKSCDYFQLDFRTAKKGQFEKLMDEVTSRMSGLDILVNDAGIIKVNTALELSEEDLEEEIQVNQKAVFWLSQAAGQFMASRRKGKIINIASLWSFQAGDYVASYTGTKSAVAGYTRAFANELGPYGINVNAIAPGWTETESTRGVVEIPELYEAKRSRIPIGRWAKPDDLRGTAVFLASPASNYLNGSILIVDGGWYVH